MHAIDTDNARWCVTVARVGGLRRLYGVTLKQHEHGHPIQRTDARPAIRSREGLRDTTRRKIADARKRLSLIAIMTQTAMNRFEGNPGYLWPV